jgi:uncharacterized protein YndB with AHSA1/START domain
MLRITIIVAGVLIGLLVLVFAVGAFLPREHTATSTITLNQPIDSVYATLRDFQAMPTWWRDARVSTRVTGMPGERWRQEFGGMKMQIDVVEAERPTRIVTRIVDEPGTPFGGRWSYDLSSTADGRTTIAITERGWIGPPPFRLMAKIFGMHATLDSMLRALGQRFGETVTPVHS